MESNIRVVQKKPKHYKLGDFNDLITLIERQTNYTLAGSEDYTGETTYQEVKYRVRGLFLMHEREVMYGNKLSSTIVENQAIRESSTYTVILPQWRKDLDTTWAIEYRKQIYRIVSMRKESYSANHYLALLLREVGSEDNQASYT